MENFDLLADKCKESGYPVSTREWDQIRKDKDYPTLRTVKKYIDILEVAVAKNFVNADFDKVASDTLKLRQLETDFEWFLTWRVKLTRFPHIIWCDGVEIAKLRNCGELTFYVEAKIWLGPESNVSIEFLCEMKGTITLNKKFDELEEYKLAIIYEDQEYLICKTI